MESDETMDNRRAALENGKTFKGLLPICAECKRIRDEEGNWNEVEDYMRAHPTAEFSHSLCPDCLAKLRDEIAERRCRSADDSSD
jgi:hypothetical protein